MFFFPRVRADRKLRKDQDCPKDQDCLAQRGISNRKQSSRPYSKYMLPQTGNHDWIHETPGGPESAHRLSRFWRKKKNRVGIPSAEMLMPFSERPSIDQSSFHKKFHVASIQER
jgi:hypothetical protein